MAETTRVHPETGKVLERGVRRLTVRYRDLSEEVEVLGWYSPDDPADDEGLLDGEDGVAIDAALVRLKARAHGLPEPEEVRRVRRRLRLSQQRAGLLLGGGPNAFHKYEKGEVVVSRPMAQLLRLLDRHPELAAELEAGDGSDIADPTSPAPSPSASSPP